MTSLVAIRQLRGTFKRSRYERFEQLFLILVLLGGAGFLGYFAISPEHVPDAKTLLLLVALILGLLALGGYVAFEFADEYTFDGVAVSRRGWHEKRNWVVRLDEISEVGAQSGRGGTFWSLKTSTRVRMIRVYASLEKASDAIEGMTT